jgi:hypothetical protein
VLAEKKSEWDATFEKSKADWAADAAQQVAAAKASAAESGAALQAQLNSALETAVRARALSRMHAAFPHCLTHPAMLSCAACAEAYIAVSHVPSCLCVACFFPGRAPLF